MKKIIYLSLVLMCLHYTVRAQVPRTLTYQGFLTDASGNPEQNPVNLVFNIYDGASSVYTATLNSVPISKGLFSVVLGKNEAGNPSIPVGIWTKQLKVGISINGASELPQVDLTVVPYAFTASNVDNVHVTDLADGSLSGAKVGTGIDATNITTGTISNAVLDDDLDDLVDGSLSGSKVGTGISATNVTTGTLINTVLDADLQDLADGSLSGSVVGSGISASNVTTGTLSNTVLDSDLQDLADGALSGSVIGTGISATNLTTGTLPIARIADDAVTSLKIADGTITATDILDGTITTTDIASLTILDGDISASAAIADSKLATISTAGKVSGNAITSGTIGGSTAVNTSGVITTTNSLVVGNPTVSTFAVDIKSGSATSAVVRIDKTAGAGSSIVDFYRAGFIVGNISESAGTISYNSFTGSHIGLSDEALEIGTLVSMTGELEHIKSNRESEPVYHVAASQKANDPKILGAFLHPFEKEGMQTNLKGQLNAIMAVGNGLMWVSENGQDIEVGDYLISSSVNGHAMKDTGEFDKAYIIGRAAETVRWSEVQDQAGAVKHKRISVFFENFTLDHKAEKMETEVMELRERISRLERQMHQLEKLISASSYPITPKP